jgi:hypothetical protein
MSALGHKQTWRFETVMSALPPKADISSALCDVRFVPKADIERGSLDDLVSQLHNGFAYRETKSFCDFEIDDEFELVGRLRWQIAR